ncbi:aspartate-semialdehyde dehydrogenase [Mangrovivirga sp. M17]|uniref:Aspartate-semialdehyde dehydrogenase n=1 Tax=Mangrovivirga halotolerans TaxID=2993936 RepID=A0ABT3RVV5_9BACT|nr:aspartate-semialdehyde dehydrogenase [Mangrovivirga halotolerans]MCX2745907.1 aspartate-semialdehyde dehydrogenase [Mangrovivirga halotolerans]
MKIAIVGATGLVGTEMLAVLEERNFKFDEMILAASARSAGKEIKYAGKPIKVMTIEDAIEKKPDIAIFSAGSGPSLEYAPKFAEVGTFVIDNSSAWRMDPDKKLIVPEINANELNSETRIIANPNCSTIQMVLVLAPLHKKYNIKRVIVSTYQSVTGTGKAAVDQLMGEREGKDVEKVYPHRIDMNALPHIDVFMDNGYTKEEMKMVNETKKILGDDSVKVTATAVRLPVMGGHSESVNIEFTNEFELEEVKNILSETPGVIVKDDPANNVYPMPIDAHKKDDVLVGRLRRDETQEKSLNLWVVADNLRKGAATNAVQIAEYLVSSGLVK